jgi:hypothetical protein
MIWVQRNGTYSVHNKDTGFHKGSNESLDHCPAHKNKIDKNLVKENIQIKAYFTNLGHFGVIFLDFSLFGCSEMVPNRLIMKILGPIKALMKA